MLVAASIVTGSRVLAAADNTVRVWAAARDLGAGQPIGEDELTVRRVRFVEEATLARYFPVADGLPTGLELIRSVGAGELLPRRAVDLPEATKVVQLPIAVDSELVPPDVGPGDVVDVYIVAPSASSGDGGESSVEAMPAALSAVTVIEAPPPSSSFGTSGKRQLVLAVSEDEAPAFFSMIAEYDLPSLTVVRRG